MKSSSKIIPVIGIVALGALLAVVFSKVLEMQFSAGTMYPHYSSQRTDPLGGQAVYDSFDRLDSFSVSRNFLKYESLKSLDGNTALILLGVPRQSVKDLRGKDDSKVLTAIREQGTRLILTVDPEIVAAEFTPEEVRKEKDWMERRRDILREREKLKPAKPDSKKNTEEEEKEGNEKTDQKGKSEESGDGDGEKDERTEVEKKVDEWLDNDEELDEEIIEAIGERLFKEWGIDFAAATAYQRPVSGWQPTIPAGTNPSGAPGVLPEWKSHLRFEIKPSAKDDWVVLAAVDGKPVVVERKFGKGTVVMTSDSYFASNEGLHNGTSPEFLLWLVGDKRRLIFDETIHGSTTSPGAMKLIKRYRLHGLFIGLFLFVALWAWRSATTLAPGSVAIDAGLIDDGSVTGEESTSGLVRLLRRSIPSKDLLSKCNEVWRSSRQVALKPEEESGIAQLIAKNRDDPKALGAVTAYQRIVDLMKKRI